jgi:hypothetical protein
MTTTREHIIRQTELRSGRTFILPEIETIEQFVELSWFPEHEDPPAGAEPYRGSRAVSPARDFYFLAGATETIPRGGRWLPLYVRARRQYGMAIKSYCTDGQIGSYKVVKGAWPDPYGLLLANDGHHIAAPFLSLIDWPGYVRWLHAQRATVLGELEGETA